MRGKARNGSPGSSCWSGTAPGSGKRTAITCGVTRGRRRDTAGRRAGVARFARGAGAQGFARFARGAGAVTRLWRARLAPAERQALGRDLPTKSAFAPPLAWARVVRSLQGAIATAQRGRSLEETRRANSEDSNQ